MKKVTFIRHGKKHYNNSKGPKGSYQHDPDIYRFSENISEKLYENNNFKYIISSPYKRTKNTSIQIQENLRKKGVVLDIMYDLDIAEYLGNQKPKYSEASLDPETNKYIKPLLGVENINNLRFRLIRFLGKVFNLNTNVLVVTHALNIVLIHNILYNKKIENIQPVSGFTYTFN